MPGGRRHRLFGEAGEHRATVVCPADVAAPLGRALMTAEDKVKILLVDDQPAKLLTYEVILRDLGDELLMAASAQEALELLLKNEIAVVLMDVCMPELDGFQLASMIREHPRFREVAMIFISAVTL